MTSVDFSVGGTARLKYRPARFDIIDQGDGHVRCAITGVLIPLENLKYWDIFHQEPYLDASASLQARQQRLCATSKK